MDYVTSAVKAVVGAAPFAGSLLVEIAGAVISNQRMDRITKFAQNLEVRLSGLEQEFVRWQLTNENLTDLMEEAMRQAARSISEVRRAHMASLIANSLSASDISYLESKHLLRILGEINDIEIIRLGSYLYGTRESGQDYRERHQEILDPVGAHLGSSQVEIDRETLQRSHDDHLAQLGLLNTRYEMDSRTKQPKFDSNGAQVVRGYRLSRLGRLLCRQVGFIEEPG